MSAQLGLSDQRIDPSMLIAIALHNEGKHLGIIYRHSEGTHRLLHLAFHYDLRDEAVGKGKYLWVSPTLHESRGRLLARLCVRIARRRAEGTLRYGIRYDGARFDSEGILVLGEKEHGLTCATFVLAVLQSNALKLVDHSPTAWPRRNEDGQRWEELIQALSDAGDEVEAEHLAAVRANVDCARFSPREIAAAALLQRRSLSRAEITPGLTAIDALLPLARAALPPRSPS